MIFVPFKLCFALLALFALHVKCQPARPPVVQQSRGMDEKHELHTRLKELIQSTAKRCWTSCRDPRGSSSFLDRFATHKENLDYPRTAFQEATINATRDDHFV